jgi:predicted MFS family arabinose efflux permease
VIGVAIAIVAASYLLLAGAEYSLALLVVGVVVLDIGVQAGLVSNQTRAFAVDPSAQGRINSLYMTATFSGGAIGVAISGWLMTYFGWIGIAVFGLALATGAGLIHRLDGRRIAATNI